MIGSEVKTLNVRLEVEVLICREVKPVNLCQKLTVTNKLQCEEGTECTVKSSVTISSEVKAVNIISQVDRDKLQ